MAIIAFGMAGVIVGLFFSLVYGVAFLVTGGMPRPDGSIISPLSAAAMYVVTCGAGGVLVGAFRSLLRSRLGSAVVGIVGIVPLLIGSSVLYEGSVTGRDWWIVVVGSILVGVPIGFAIRKEYRSF